MKGKRYTTEEKIRILREADGTGRKIQDVCRERQISGKRPTNPMRIWWKIGAGCDYAAAGISSEA